MSPIIVTLGALTLMRGLAQYLSPAPLFGFPEGFSYLGYGTVLGLPILTLTGLVLVAVAWRSTSTRSHPCQRVLTGIEALIFTPSTVCK